METDTNFFLMFGRLEGKVDALLSNQSRTDARLDEVEKRVADIETTRTLGLGMFQAAHLIWIAVAGVIGMFADQIIAFLFKS